MPYTYHAPLTIILKDCLNYPTTNEDLLKMSIDAWLYEDCNGQVPAIKHVVKSWMRKNGIQHWTLHEHLPRGWVDVYLRAIRIGDHELPLTQEQRESLLDYVWEIYNYHLSLMNI